MPSLKAIWQRRRWVIYPFAGGLCCGLIFHILSDYIQAALMYGYAIMLLITDKLFD